VSERQDETMSPSARRGRDPDEISDAIVAASQALLEMARRTLDEQAPELNLSHLQVLTMLERQGPQRLIDVADALAVTSTTATRLADRLTEAGMVERVRVSDDRREVHLALSDGGRELVAALSSRRRSLVKARLAGCSPAEERVGLALLTRLASPFDDTGAESA